MLGGVPTACQHGAKLGFSDAIVLSHKDGLLWHCRSLPLLGLEPNKQRIFFQYPSYIPLQDQPYQEGISSKGANKVMLSRPTREIIGMCMGMQQTWLFLQPRAKLELNPTNKHSSNNNPPPPPTCCSNPPPEQQVPPPNYCSTPPPTTNPPTPYRRGMRPVGPMAHEAYPLDSRKQTKKKRQELPRGALVPALKALLQSAEAHVRLVVPEAGLEKLSGGPPDFWFGARWCGGGLVAWWLGGVVVWWFGGLVA